MSNKIIIFDLDGTLADIRHRRHFVEPPPYFLSSEKDRKPDWDSFHKACVDDKPNKPIIGLFKSIYNASHDYYMCFGEETTMEIWSGRSDIVRIETEIWLYNQGIGSTSYSNLRMRPHGDYRPDIELKRQWLYEVGKENVLMVFDDRQQLVDMWRAEGLTCLQVAEGNF